MGGLLILALFLGYVQLVWFICKKTPTIWAKALVLLVAVLAVSADAIYGRKKLEQMCEQKSGLKIYKTVDNVEGVDLRYWKPEADWIKNSKYKFIETDAFTSLGRVDRRSVQSDGTILEEKDVLSKSTYKIRTKSIKKFSNYYISNTIMIVSNNQSIVAEASVFGYYGGWVERFIGSIYASRKPVIWCGNEEYFDIYYWKENITKILKPPKQEL